MTKNNTKVIIDDLKLRYIRMKKPIKINNYLETNQLFYRINNQSQPIIIQTPRLYLPFGLSQGYQSEKYYLNMVLDTSMNSEKIKDFQKLINNIDKYFQDGFENYKFKKTIRNSRDNFYPPSIKTKISKKTPPQIFDSYEQPQKLDYIVPGSWISGLLYLQQIWINQQENIAGLTWYILQAKVKTPVPVLGNICLIEDDWSQETLCSICHSKVVKTKCVEPIIEAEPLPEEYQKYLKMLKLGIPMLAIIQRCQMDDLDPEVLIDYQKNQGRKSDQNNASASKKIAPFLNQIKKPQSNGLGASFLKDIGKVKLNQPKEIDKSDESESESDPKRFKISMQD